MAMIKSTRYIIRLFPLLHLEMLRIKPLYTRTFQRLILQLFTVLVTKSDMRAISV